MSDRDPYLLGLKASQDGKPLSACPYKKSHPMRKWQLGWYDGPRKALLENPNSKEGEENET